MVAPQQKKNARHQRQLQRLSQEIASLKQTCHAVSGSVDSDHAATAGHATPVLNAAANTYIPMSYNSQNLVTQCGPDLHNIWLDFNSQISGETQCGSAFCSQAINSQNPGLDFNSQEWRTQSGLHHLYTAGHTSPVPSDAIS
eukprot:8255378-Karenia_brevis.AAC.1